MKSTTHLVPLGLLGLDDAERVGKKAAVLGEARRLGFDVPDGFAVPWRTVTQVAQEPGEDAFSVEFRAAVQRALESMGGVPVAVRSSGVDEDLSDQSYAGQYESVLDVRGVDEVLRALLRCRASASAPHLAVYREGERAPARIGVVVQAMVAADSAGAAFSANPVTGDRGENLISAVAGVGDRLLAGQSMGDEWSVRDKAARLVAGAGTALTVPQAHEVAALAARAEARFGTPQDVEWAYADGKLWLLQARPITTLPDRPEPGEIEVPPGFHVRDPRSPVPRTELESSLYLPVLSSSAAHLFAFTTGAAVSAARIGGWVYLTPGPATRGIEEIAREIDENVPLALVKRWQSEWKPGYGRRISQLGARALESLDDTQLALHTEEVASLFADLHDVYFRVAGACLFLNAELGALEQRLPGWTPGDLLSLRQGLTGDHMEAIVDLAALARRAGAHDALCTALRADPVAAAERLHELSADFAAAFAAYLSEHGHRSPGFDLTERTFAEQPEAVLALVAAQLDAPFDVEERRAVLERRTRPLRTRLAESLADLPAAERARFEEAYASAELSAPVRDEKSHLAVSVWALLRYAVLETGARLAAAGQIDQQGDVFHLPLTHALGALRSPRDLRDEARRARDAFTHAQGHPGPAHYGTAATGPATAEPAAPGAAPSRSVDRVLAVRAAATQAMGPRPDPADRPGVLMGLGASAGLVTGPARLVHGPDDFVRVRQGDILVCPETTAQWAVLFPSLGGLVADNGSLLSHPAILAREYGIPAVVATGRATSALRDGDLIELNGIAGTVRTVGVTPVGDRP